MSPRRWYRTLLRLYPREFRARYGDEMVEAFLRLLELAGDRGGRAARARVWLGAAVDAARRGLAARLGAVDAAGGSETGRMATPRKRGGKNRMMVSVLSDLRFGARSLTRRPFFSLMAVAALALGVGASTAIFSVVNGFVLSPLPYEEPDRLVALWAAHPERGWSHTDVSMVEAWEWGQRSDALAAVSIHDDRRVTLTSGDRPEFVDAIFATANVFDVVGVQPVLGRGFVPGDNREGAEGVAVLTHGFWNARFDADPAALGRTLELNGETYTVVGILPEGFYYTDEFADVFLTWRTDPVTARRGNHSVEAVGRLASGPTVDQLRQELARITREQGEAHPEANEGWAAEVVPLRADVAGEVATRASLILMVAGVFVLIMACVNVANLLLARANGRRREMAIRAALGAGRARVVLQLLMESSVLASLGGAVGLALAAWGSRAIAAAMPESIMTPARSIGMDWRVFAFTAAVTLASVFAIGLLPALRTSRTDPDALADRGRGGTGRQGRRFGSGLVVVQTAVAMVLLVAGGILFRSVSSMQRAELGFQAEGVLTVGLIPPESDYEDGAALNELYDRITEEIRGIPGVEEAGWIHSLPLLGNNWSAAVRIPGIEIPGDQDGLPVRTDYVSPGYLETMEIDLRRGRTIDERDRADGEPVVVVNEAFVSRYLGDRDPLASQVDGLGQEHRRIVGVVANTVERALDRPSEPTVFVPQAQRPTRRRFLAARTANDPMARELVDHVQRRVWSVDPELPLLAGQPMTALVSSELAGFELIARLMAAFALLALLLGAVGIYGVTTYGVSQRRNEIGVRMALGAGQGQVRLKVVRDGMVRAGVGLAAGTLLAIALTRALESLLVGVSATDPLTFGVVAVLLAGVSLLAAYLPARRASAIDPVRALTGG